MRALRQWAALLLLAIVAGSAAAPAPALAAVPTGFSDTFVASVPSPTALAFTPDGRMLITSQLGALRVYKNGALLTQPALSLGTSVCTNSERGLLGVAVDPSFATNGYVYIFYTYAPNGNCTGVVNRVSRFTMQGDVALGGSELVLVDNMPSPNGNHNAGDLHFGKDGYLYISIGDGGPAANARRRDILSGKILRVRKEDGAPAPGNPWTGQRCGDPAPGFVRQDGIDCAETFAWGLRNPFRLAFDEDAATTHFYINDVGAGTWEEINLGAANADYGWSAREGPCAIGDRCEPPFDAPPIGMTNPIFAYNRVDDSPSCTSITGGAFVPSAAGWPAEYAGAYLYADFVCSKMVAITPGASGGFAFDRADFATGMGNPVFLRFGPHAGGYALYYTRYGSGGQVRRIVFSGGNRTPIAVASADPTYTAASSLTVNFNGAGSSDPDDDALTYEWDFGDGATGAGVTPSHTYNGIGRYDATLRVRDARGALSAPATIRIDLGNTPPDVTMTSPADGATFAVGETIALQGSATDAEDAGAPTLTWQVVLHHADHTHPFLPPTNGNNLTFVAPAPEDLAAATNSYLEVLLTATDSTGLARTIARRLDPNAFDVDLTTTPAGLRVAVNDVVITTPATIRSWEGYELRIVAPAQPDGAGDWWRPAAGTNRTVTTPANDTAVNAEFVPAEVSILTVLGR
jgi:glucose/arabinose dehydrogenase/PKD repeat protein